MGGRPVYRGASPASRCFLTIRWFVTEMQLQSPGVGSAGFIPGQPIDGRGEWHSPCDYSNSQDRTNERTLRIESAATGRRRRSARRVEEASRGQTAGARSAWSSS